MYLEYESMNFLKHYFNFLKNRSRSLRRVFRHWNRVWKIRVMSAFFAEKKIIIGSGGTKYPGWVATELEELNLLIESNWKHYFDEGSLCAILAEHVWEHLTPDESRIAIENSYKFLKKGGYLRVAVPDGFHPEPQYINDVKPGGRGAGADDHKVLLTHEYFRECFESAGFKVELLEYFDRDGCFHYSEWNISDGFVGRSMRFDERNKTNPLSYTSLILDATKL
jgi:predicted SAM-dependent methyltransferase